MRKKFQALIQTMRPDYQPTCLELISILDNAGIAHYISDEHATVVGYIPAELVGKSVIEYVHPTDQAYAHQRFEHLKANLTPITTEFRFRHKNGGWVDLKADVTPLPKNEYCDGFLVVSNEVVDLSALMEDCEIEALCRAIGAQKSG